VFNVIERLGCGGLILCTLFAGRWRDHLRERPYFLCVPVTLDRRRTGALPNRAARERAYAIATIILKHHRAALNAVCDAECRSGAGSDPADQPRPRSGDRPHLSGLSRGEGLLLLIALLAAVMMLTLAGLGVA
jgi:hypothetical protein